ncbi:fasciclin domain-containing protein [Chitinophaga silvisoli]|uniref:fasciclin domain-containing protein n=1 Tax=Chitinophaga silvisoli TaxID=2291814 RepID=UPI0018F22706|nr:fasciclin domain-containing protein [Chitinophaga silvisoli]
MPKPFKAGPGPLTVFAPTNKAFDKLPKGAVETLLKPENKTIHVVAGNLDSKALAEKIKEGNSKPELTTVQGVNCGAWMQGNSWC